MCSSKGIIEILYRNLKKFKLVGIACQGGDDAANVRMLTLAGAFVKKITFFFGVIPVTDAGDLILRRKEHRKWKR